MTKITKQELDSLQAIVIYELLRTDKQKQLFKDILILAKLVDKLKRIK